MFQVCVLIAQAVDPSKSAPCTCGVTRVSSSCKVHLLSGNRPRNFIVLIAIKALHNEDHDLENWQYRLLSDLCHAKKRGLGALSDPVRHH